MTLGRLGMGLLVLGLTVASGLCDAQGFVNAARIWEGGRLNAGMLGRSALGFATGISIYFVLLRFLDHLGVRAAEVQTLMWFGVTLLGVAVMRGKFLTWPRVDQGIGVLVLTGIAWLLVRNPA